MNPRNRMVGLVGMLAILLAACAGGNGQVAKERDAELSDLRRQVESLRSQVVVKDQEAKRLAAGAAAAKKLEEQVTSLEERLKLMQDIVMTKDEQVTRLEVQIEDLKKAAVAKGPTKKTAPTNAPAMKAKPEAAAKAKDKP